MLNVYFNYPNSVVTVHGTAGCPHVRQQRKDGQRIVQISRTTLSADLLRFKEREFKFVATALLNDLWVKVDLSDTDLEMAVAKHIRRQLGKYYKRFADATLRIHC